MKNSIIIQLLVRIFKAFVAYYNSSVTSRIINSIVDKLEVYIENSKVLDFFKFRKEKDIAIQNSLIMQSFGEITHKLLDFLRNMYVRGVDGSYIVRYGKVVVRVTKEKSLLKNISDACKNSIIIRGLEKIFIFEPEE